jgi:hypothetical protein
MHTSPEYRRMAGDFEDNGVYWMGGCVEICHGILGTTLRVIDRVT